MRKTIALLVIGALVGGAVIWFWQPKELAPVEGNNQVEWRDASTEGRTGVLKGYYTSVERTAWEETQRCDSFVITGGSPALVSFFGDLLDRGNTVNNRNELGQPVVNIDLESLPLAIQERVKSSSVDRKVELLITRPIIEGKGAPVCYSFVSIEGIR